MSQSRKESARYLRSFVFGVEDSLVSTVGLLSGVAFAGVPRATIFLTGVILVCVEAFSMAVGIFLSEQSADDYAVQRDAPIRQAVSEGFIMLISYLVSGLIPLLPYIIWSGESALWYSVGSSLVALFFLGYWSGRLSKISSLKSAARMALIGGAAIFVGILIGQFVRL